MGGPQGERREGGEQGGEHVAAQHDLLNGMDDEELDVAGTMSGMGPLTSMTTGTSDAIGICVSWSRLVITINRL